jgi:PAS domain S-box-containing protein
VNLKNRPIRVLLIEDNPGDARLIREMLSSAAGMSFDLTCEPSLAEGIRSLGEDTFDTVLLDLTLPDSRGIDTFKSFYSADSKLPVIVLTGLDDEETALTAMQGGAQDYLVKGRVDGELLARSIRYSIERRQAENELRVKDQAMGSSVNAIALAGLDNRLTYVNRSALELWGYREEGEMLGRDIREIWVDPESLRQVEEGLETRGAWSGELAGRRKDGSFFDALVNASVVLDKGGEPICFMAVIVDITERKRTTERLEELNRCLLSLGHDPRANLERILAAGRSILEAGALKYLSRVREKEYIYTRSQHIAEHLDCGYPCCALTGCAGEGVPLAMHVPSRPPCEGRHPDLEELGLIPVLACPVKALDEVVGALCLFTAEDGQVSPEAPGLLVMLARALAIEEERYRHEEDMRDFIDVASHELRHPITIMKGYAAMLRDRRDAIDESNREVILDIIEHGADRLNDLVGGLLDISRIERGRFEVNREEQPLAPLVERALEEIRMRGFSNEFRLEIYKEPGDRRVDGEKIVHMMVILLENAVKYSPSGDPIEVEVEIEAGGGGAALVTVKDRGIGVAETDSERVFDRFFQVEDVLHHSTPGMGMGLYVARNIAEAHGGRIWCEPREGGGTVFRFTLPVEVEEETAKQD